MFEIDRLIIQFDKGLRTLFAPAQTARPVPGDELPETGLSEAEKKLAVSLLRVDHSGEICAQALYQGQALTARDPAVQKALEQAAWEETEHLAWCERRIAELGGRTSLLNPLWYTGSLAIGTLAGVLGDKWNLGFLAETERQVEAHLDRHLKRLPEQDAKSRAIVDQMRIDEIGHAATAVNHGGVPLPLPVKAGMKLTARVMTGLAYWV